MVDCKPAMTPGKSNQSTKNGYDESVDSVEYLEWLGQLNYFDTLARLDILYLVSVLFQKLRSLLLVTWWK
jgi:hypothetical protein